MVYKPEVTTNTTYKEYYGKSGDNNHMQFFWHISHINDTESPKYLWKSKPNRTDYHLKWSISSYASRYKCGTRKCDLCLTEKKWLLLEQTQKFYWTKERNWYQNVIIGTSLFCQNHLNWHGNYVIIYVEHVDCNVI